MNTTEAIRARRSVRKYQAGKTIPQEHMDLILEAAMCAPSANNSRPWAFVVVESDEMKRIVAEHVVNGMPVHEFTIGAAEK